MGSEVDVNEILREYCTIGTAEEVLKALRDGAAINSQNRVNGWTPLHCASRREHAAILRTLLENGAEVNLRNNKGEKPVDMTSNKQIKEILENYEKRQFANALPSPEDKSQNNDQAHPEAGIRVGLGLVNESQGPMNFVPGYLANTVFPYTLATANPLMHTRTDNNNAKAESSEPAQVLVPGYLANPIYAVATGNRLVKENNTSENDTPTNETPVNFVPGYLANPVFPYAVGTPGLANNESNDEFKQMFVPHVEQFGSLVNTYVNSLQSLEKPGDYRMCDSCKTTPVPNVFVGPTVSEIVVKVRKANIQDDDFIEVELNRKVLTYEELLDVCSKELRISRSEIVKIRKLPNTIIRRDKDVKRLQPYQELEVFME